jgi:2-iminobutanoate/2-iminopropanoate deaminase
MKSFYKCFFGVATLLSSCLWSNNNLIEVWTDEAPQVIGPYSQAVQAGEYLFISGQLAINPNTNRLTGDTIEEQTAQVLNNIESILRSQGLAFKDVVKTEVYLKDMNDFKGMNAIYAQRFSHAIKPARQAMQVAKLPLDGLVEISCIAFSPNLSAN